MVLLEIPLWFFGLDFIIYSISSVFAFLVSYYAYQSYKLAGKNSHFKLYISFLLLGAGMLAVSISSLVIVMEPTLGIITPLDMFSGLDDLGYWIYYATSIIAYVLLAYTYFKESRSKSTILAPALLISWPMVYVHFNLISFFLLIFTVFSTAINFAKKRNTNSLLVLLGFSLIALHHLLLIFIPFINSIYIISHGLLILGFMFMAIVLQRVR
jgi:hypothetical protein